MHRTSAGISASTFSIAACDLERRKWGLAVASRFLAIGALSAWAEPDVGAVATQSWIKASAAWRACHGWEAGPAVPARAGRVRWSLASCAIKVRARSASAVTTTS